MPVFQDVKFNAQRNTPTSEFFRNPFGIPNNAEVILPDDTVPVFLMIGNSTGAGFTNSGWTYNDLQLYVDAQGDDWPTEAYDGSAVGWFWNKYLSTSDNGVTWHKLNSSNGGTNAIGDVLLDTTTSGGLGGGKFEPLHPRLGGQNLAGTFTYRTNDGDPAQDLLDLGSAGIPGAICPLWDFARSIKGLFKTSSGATVAPYFIFLNLASTRFGTPGLTSYASLGITIPLDFHSRYGISSVDFSTETINDGADSTNNNYMEMFYAGGVSGYEWEHYVTIQNPSAAASLSAYDYEVGDKLIFSGSFDNSADATLSATSNPIEFAFEMTIDASTQVDAQEAAWYYQNSYLEVTGYNKGNPLYATAYSEPRWIKGPPELTDIPAGSRDENLYLEIYADPNGGSVYDTLSITLSKDSAGNLPDNDLGWAYRQFRQTFIRPAVDYIINTLGKNPVLAGNLLMIGASEAQAARTEIEQASAAIAFLDYNEAIRYDLGISSGEYPYLFYKIWQTGTAAGEVGYPVDNVKRLQVAQERLFKDAQRRAVPVADSVKSKRDPDGIHFKPIGTAAYGEAYAQAYLAMISATGRGESVMPTMANTRQGPPPPVP